MATNRAHMGNTRINPSFQCGWGVTQVRGVCDDIMLPERSSLKGMHLKGMHVMAGMKCSQGCMGQIQLDPWSMHSLHSVTWEVGVHKELSLSGTPGLLDISPPPLPPPPPPPIPAGRLEYRRLFASSKRQLGFTARSTPTTQDFSCFFTLHEEVHSLLQGHAMGMCDHIGKRVSRRVI